jgi:YegS/Rv2252/BmrU family lipid kinase
LFRHGGNSDFRLALDTRAVSRDTDAVRTCLIFNPAARGDKARRLRQQLDGISTEAVLKLTSAPGDARRLAQEAVQEGFETIVAAGGDGTLNEVLNGIGDVPNGFERARLAVLPLGTVNVFARELGIPSKPAAAWEIIRAGGETRIDLPRVEYQAGLERQRRYFAQLAGAGLDARAIELVKWQVKKAVGPLAYVLAGFHALLGPTAKIKVAGVNCSSVGGLVLVGNGRLYGGQFRLFPEADLRDGLLEICVLPRMTWMTLARCTTPLLVRGTLPSSATELFRTAAVTLTSETTTPLQVDGEMIGHLPATFTIEKSRLRVVVPRTAQI